MTLQSLVLCSDEKIVRVLRRVLSDLEIGVENCSDASSAIRKLTRRRFEAVIVDCADEATAAQVLKSVRVAPCNKHAIAMAIVDGHTAVRSAFELGAHFVLYKPISLERTKASFRAARALMKRERRRNTRIAIELPVTLTFEQKGSAHPVNATTSDLGEGGMAVQLRRRPNKSGPLRVRFILPLSQAPITTAAEIAWENAGSQVGIRFVDVTPQDRAQLKAWVQSHSPDVEPDDPPLPCKLTDLSLGGCYLEIAAPFPVGTRVLLSMRVAELEVQVEGLVRVMYPESGIGVEFTQKTEQQRQQVEKFIRALMSNEGVLPELLVEADGFESEAGAGLPADGEGSDGIEDPLIDLFRKQAKLPADAFLLELRKQRRSGLGVSEPALTI